MFGSEREGKPKTQPVDKVFVMNVALIEYSFLNLFILSAKLLVHEITSLEVNQIIRKL